MDKKKFFNYKSHSNILDYCGRYTALTICDPYGEVNVAEA